MARWSALCIQPPYTSVELDPSNEEALDLLDCSINSERFFFLTIYKFIDQCETFMFRYVRHGRHKVFLFVLIVQTCSVPFFLNGDWSLKNIFFCISPGKKITC